MIGIEWGNTQLRAFRIAADGTVRDRRSSARGIQALLDGRFAETLREEIGPWLAAGEQHVLIAGQAGGARGWKPTPLLPCPAGAPDLAAALVAVPFDWAQVKLVPGLSGTDAAGVPDVMRGEETPVLGVMADLGGSGLACLPGSQSTWATVESGRIVHFATHMTGEATEAFAGAIPLRPAPASTTALPAFDAGVVRSGQPGGLLHHVFGIRALLVAGALPGNDAAAALSGVLIGHEVRAAMPAAGSVVQVIGAPALTALYARAIAACGGYAERHDGEAPAHGLALIGRFAAWG